MLLGADVNRDTRRRDEGGGGSLGSIADIFKPVFPDPETQPHQFKLYPSLTQTRKVGLYGSLRLRPADRWAVIVGGRYTLKDHYSGSQQRASGVPLESGRRQDNVLVPYLGVIHEITPRTSLYASTAEIYQSQADKLTGDGAPLDPVRGRTYEMGAKSDLTDRLVGSVSVYRIEKKHTASELPALNPGDPAAYAGDGYLLSQGIELELNGHVTPRWQTSVGYTYNSNENKRLADGRFNTRTPRHLLKVWTDYHFGSGDHGFKLGAGAVAQSRSHSSGGVTLYNPVSGAYDIASPDFHFEEPGRAVWSMNAEYAFNANWSLALNVNNVFDKVYYRSVRNVNSENYYGEPRNALLSMRARF